MDFKLAFIVEMARGTPGEPGFECWSCDDATWKGLLSIAKCFGWVPLGTVVDERMASYTAGYRAHFKSTYDPEEWGHCKRLNNDDAKALSGALYAAIEMIDSGKVATLQRPGPTVLREDFDLAELSHVNLSITGQLKRFADFASRGGFAFAWDD